MLKTAGIKFESVSPLCDEDSIKKQKSHLKLSELALELAKAKAESVSGEYPDAYVIGSDQICEFNGKSISKAKDKADAFRCLKMLEGNTHTQNNGTCIYHNGKCVYEFAAKAVLTMKPLTNEQINAYIEQDNPVGCAGSYKFELNGKYLFSRIEGNEECIKGFGLSKVLEWLKLKD